MTIHALINLVQSVSGQTMSVTIHHQPIASGSSWHLRAWQLSWDGNSVWDADGLANGTLVDFSFPDVAEPRALSFKYRSSLASGGPVVWEPDDFVRQLSQVPPSEIWTFEQSRRVLYRAPFPSGVPPLSAGDVLTFTAITRSRFAGGRLYAWNPYRTDAPSAYFPQSARDDAAGISTFVVTLADWMTAGFHLKLTARDSQGNDLWEPDSSNRIWRPCDGAALWLKSGQCDVRSEPLVLTTLSVQVLVPASLQPVPTLVLRDTVEQLDIPVAVTDLVAAPNSVLFNIATYEPQIYPQAAYSISANSGESPAISRPFPADPGDPSEPSLFALGAGSWLEAFPPVSAVQLAIEPRTPSSFDAGVSAQVSVGNAPPYQTVAAVRSVDGSWTAALMVAEDTTSCVRLTVPTGSEPKPYDWIDTGRYFTPAGAPTLFTTEGVFGVTTRGKTPFAEPPSRSALMIATFGSAISGSGVFGTNELTHGTTLLDSEVYFVVHAPHAAWAELVLVVGGVAPGREQRGQDHGLVRTGAPGRGRQ